MKSNIFLGLDIGGTNIRLGAFNQKFLLIKTAKIKTLVNNYYQCLQEIFTIISQWQTEFNIIFVGIGAPGMLNQKTGQLLDLSNLPDWCGKYIVNDFAKYFQHKIPIRLENDANVAALGHFLQKENHHQINGYLFFTFSTGIGAGYIYQQKIFTGAQGKALELANVIIDGKCEVTVADNSILNCNSIEEKCGGNGIIRSFYQAGKEIKDTKEAFLLFQQNNLIAQDILTTNQHRLAVFLANSIAYLDPEVIAVGGTMALKNKEYFSSIFQQINNYLLPSMQDRKFEFVADESDLPALLGAAFLQN